MGIELRNAVASDWRRVALFLESVDLPREGVREQLAHFFVAEDDGALVGTAGAELYADKCMLRSVAVAPERRGLGLGKTLCERVLEYARSRGVDTAYLITGDAADYFVKLGFARTDRERVDEKVKASVLLRGACPCCATVMVKKLAPPAR